VQNWVSLFFRISSSHPLQEPAEMNFFKNITQFNSGINLQVSGIEAKEV